MDKFNLKQYLTEGRLHKESTIDTNIVKMHGDEIDYELAYDQIKQSIMSDMGYEDEDMEDGSIEDEVNRAADMEFEEQFGSQPYELFEKFSKLQNEDTYTPGDDEFFSKDYNVVKDFQNKQHNELVYDYEGELDNIGIELVTSFKDDEDMTLAGMLDGYLLQSEFDGDEEAYEENDYKMRDHLLQQIAQAIDSVIKNHKG